MSQWLVAVRHHAENVLAQHQNIQLSDQIRRQFTEMLRTQTTRRPPCFARRKVLS
ncbi:DUF1778 domain-containing protein [Sulfobacillus thermosulfidooxidans]|uniref:type II toxin -antitoxin system TacA 1-like antitoxin n=1 Tax=Sulfobacillus thermosulfidooxidans TaxID=28034 RepID=UPI001494F769